MADSLLDRTLSLLEASELSRRDIARNAEVGYEWLKKLGKTDEEGNPLIPNPGVLYIQKLHDFLVLVQRDKATCKSTRAED